MRIELCIARAIHEDLDIMEAIPEIIDVPVEELEEFVERYVMRMQEELCGAILNNERHLHRGDAAALFAACRLYDLKVPDKNLFKICQKVVKLYTTKGVTSADGASWFLVHLQLHD